MYIFKVRVVTFFAKNAGRDIAVLDTDDALYNAVL